MNTHEYSQVHYSSLKTTDYTPKIQCQGDQFPAVSMCSIALCSDQRFLLQMQGDCTDVETTQGPLLLRDACGMYEGGFASSKTIRLVYCRFHLRPGISSQMTTLVHIFLVCGLHI
jgi:hypothetical protein